MKTTSSQCQKSLHYGHEVRAKLEERGMTPTEFAKRIGCCRSNVYNIFNREAMDTGLLNRISDVLGFDFIHDL